AGIPYPGNRGAQGRNASIQVRGEPAPDGIREHSARGEAVGVSHRLPRVLAPSAGVPPAERELGRFRVRQPDAGAGRGLRLLDRRDLVPDEILSRGVIHQPAPLHRLRYRGGADRHPVPSAQMEGHPGPVPFPCGTAARRWWRMTFDLTATVLGVIVAAFL